MIQDDDNRAFRLTETGEAYAVDLLGGQDVINVGSALQHLLRQHGDVLGGEHTTPDIREWATCVTVAKIWRFFMDDTGWQVIVKTLEQVLESETDYFSHTPHAVMDIDD